jgi:hypothetical protein
MKCLPPSLNRLLGAINPRPLSNRMLFIGVSDLFPEHLHVVASPQFTQRMAAPYASNNLEARSSGHLPFSFFAARKPALSLAARHMKVPCFVWP